MQFELIGCHSLNVWGKKMQSPIRQCQQQISVSRRSLVSNKERGPRFPFPLLLLPAIWSQHRKPAILPHPPYIYLREERSVCIEWSRIITKEIQVHASLGQFLSSAVAIKIRCDDIYLLFFFHAPSAHQDLSRRSLFGSASAKLSWVPLCQVPEASKPYQNASSAPAIWLPGSSRMNTKQIQVRGEAPCPLPFAYMICRRIKEFCDLTCRVYSR